MTTNEEEKRWKFAQCFGDKGDSDDITEGTKKKSSVTKKKSVYLILFYDKSRYYFSCRV